MNPKFRINEEAGVESRTDPAINGIYTITHFQYYERRPVKNTEEDAGPGFLYQVAPDVGWVLEESLRKIHKPGNMSFNQLINWMKQPQKLLTHQPQ